MRDRVCSPTRRLSEPSSRSCNSANTNGGVFVVETITCIKCGAEKNIDEYHWRNKSKGIRKTTCKTCRSEESIRYKRKNRDKIDAWSKLYYQQNKQRLKEYNKKWREDNKLKNKNLSKAEESTVKVCPRCKIEKPISEFFVNKSRRDARTCYCKICCKFYHKKTSPEKRREYERRWREQYPEKKKEKDRRYAEPHREKLAQKQRLYRKNNPNKIREYNEKWARSNPEKVKAYIIKTNKKRHEVKLQWQREHPEAGRENQRKRRARLKNVLVIPFTKRELNQRLSMFGNKCWICGSSATAVDHVKPIARGGAHILANLRPICCACNSKKGSTWPLSG